MTIKFEVKDDRLGYKSKADHTSGDSLLDIC